MQNESKHYAMNYEISDLPEDQSQWDELWQQLQDENDLRRDRDCYQFLTQMVMGITSTMSELNDGDRNYGDWRVFVNFVFEEWLVYDNILNEFND